MTEIFGTLMILAGILIFLALVSFESQLPGAGDAPLPESNMIGTVGHYSAQLLLYLFGKSAFLLGPYLFLLGFLTFYRGGFTDPLSRVVAVLVVMAGTSLLGALVYQVDGHPSEIAGGLLGARVGQAFQILFGTYGGFILAMGIFLTGVFLAIRIPVPVFLGQLNRRIVTALRGYSQALNGHGQMGYREAYSAAGAGAAPPVPESMAGQAQEVDEPEVLMDDANQDPIQLVRKEVASAAGENRPWIERVSLEDSESESDSEYDAASDFGEQSIDAASDSDQPEDDDTLYNDFPEEPVPVREEMIHGLNQRTRISSNARHFQSALAEIESRTRRGENSDWLGNPGRATTPAPRAPREPSPRPSQERSRTGTSTTDQDLSGYFNDDETRFHFRASPVARPARAGRPGAFAPESRTAVRDFRDVLRPDTRAPNPQSNVDADAAFLEPLDLELIQPRQRTPHRAPAHSLADLESYPNTNVATDTPAQMERDLQAESLAGSALDLQTPEETEFLATEMSAANQADVGFEVESPAGESDLENFTGTDFENSSEFASNFSSEESIEENLEENIEGTPEEAEFAAEALADDTSRVTSREVSQSVSPPIMEPPRRVPPKKKPVAVSAVPRFQAKSGTRRYHLPGNLLQPAQVPAREDVSREIEVTRERLEKVMQDYGIQARVVQTQRGPIITLYEIKLEAGVRVSRILGISDEIKMNLEAPSIRIIAPIPGKPTVGIEIPNRHREGVVLGDMLDREVMARSELCVVLGKNIAGEKQYVDLARLPHLLIAGSTGSGKSVYMNAIIASLLYTRSPEDVRFIMIDPKMVELKLFEGIPHLIMPVITDVRQASKALTWVINEMERRYEILSHLKSRDIRSYNDRIAAETRLPGFETEQPGEPKREKMPYIVVFIDELSDLMMVAAKDVEDSIIRLTQKARAVGIHVVMATQRPSVDVITALIKANCPARIAFHVAQKTDSRTILDMNGAETLLGKGDMLYRSPSSTALVRLQAPLLTEEEIESVVQETARYGQPAYVDLEAYIEEENTEAAENDVDAELLQQAWKIVLESGKTSTSYIQRRLRIGYNRAASLIEMLEQKGYLSPAIGNKPREILKRS